MVLFRFSLVGLYKLVHWELIEPRNLYPFKRELLGVNGFRIDVLLEIS